MAVSAGVIVSIAGKPMQYGRILHFGVDKVRRVRCTAAWHALYAWPRAVHEHCRRLASCAGFAPDLARLPRTCRYLLP